MWHIAAQHRRPTPANLMPTRACTCRRTNGTNLFVGDLRAGSVAYLTNRGRIEALQGPKALEVGAYGISNGVLGGQVAQGAHRLHCHRCFPCMRCPLRLVGRKTALLPLPRMHHFSVESAVPVMCAGTLSSKHPALMR